MKRGPETEREDAKAAALDSSAQSTIESVRGAAPFVRPETVRKTA